MVTIAFIFFRCTLLMYKKKTHFTFTRPDRQALLEIIYTYMYTLIHKNAFINAYSYSSAYIFTVSISKHCIQNIVMPCKQPFIHKAIHKLKINGVYIVDQLVFKSFSLYLFKHVPYFQQKSIKKLAWVSFFGAVEEHI